MKFKCIKHRIPISSKRTYDYIEPHKKNDKQCPLHFYENINIRQLTFSQNKLEPCLIDYYEDIVFFIAKGLDFKDWTITQ